MRARMQHMKVLLPCCLILLVAACSDDAPVECQDRADDATGYLQPICEYIQANLPSYESDPSKLTILALTPGDEVPGTGPYNTSDYDWVRLSCCYTGDTAVIRKADRTVVAFNLGAI